MQIQNGNIENIILPLNILILKLVKTTKTGGSSWLMTSVGNLRAVFPQRVTLTSSFLQMYENMNNMPYINGSCRFPMIILLYIYTHKHIIESKDMGNKKKTIFAIPYILNLGKLCFKTIESKNPIHDSFTVLEL